MPLKLTDSSNIPTGWRGRQCRNMVVSPINIAEDYYIKLEHVGLSTRDWLTELTFAVRLLVTILGNLFAHDLLSECVLTPPGHNDIDDGQ